MPPRWRRLEGETTSRVLHLGALPWASSGRVQRKHWFSISQVTRAGKEAQPSKGTEYNNAVDQLTLPAKPPVSAVIRARRRGPVTAGHPKEGGHRRSFCRWQSATRLMCHLVSLHAYNSKLATRATVCRIAQSAQTVIHVGVGRPFAYEHYAVVVRGRNERTGQQGVRPLPSQ